MTTLRPSAHLPPSRPDDSHMSPPDSRLGKFIWRRRMWFETTFAISVMEPWEKWLLLTMFMVLFTLLVNGLITLPHRLGVMQRRSVYYLWGRSAETMVGAGLTKEL